LRIAGSHVHLLRQFLLVTMVTKFTKNSNFVVRFVCIVVLCAFLRYICGLPADTQPGQVPIFTGPSASHGAKVRELPTVLFFVYKIIKNYTKTLKFLQKL